MATQEDRRHSLATALVALVPSACSAARLGLSPAPSCGAPAGSSRNPKLVPRVLGLRGQAQPRTRPVQSYTENSHLGQHRLGSLRKPAKKAAHQQSPPGSRTPPGFGRTLDFPAASINEFKHFPAQQLEPLLVLHLCLINEIASNLNIS